MSLPFRPIQDRVICRKDARERLLSSGLLIPHVDDPDRQVADERDVAEVLGVGPGRMLADGSRRDMPIREGDVVIFGRNKGQMIRYQEQDYCVLNEEHVIGKINGHGLEPLGGYIIAVQERSEQKTDGGVVLPAVADDREEAQVLAVGPGLILDDGTREEMLVQPGDTVLFNPRMAEPIVSEGRECLALLQKHIVCVTNR